GSEDCTIRVWDVDTGRVVSGPFEGHTGGVNSVAFSPNGKHIVSGSNDSTIRVWDVDTGRGVSGPFRGHTDGVNSVAFSTDGTHIVSGSKDNTIRVWDVDTGRVVSGPFEGHTDGVNSVTATSILSLLPHSHHYPNRPTSLNPVCCLIEQVIPNKKIKECNWLYSLTVRGTKPCRVGQPL